MRKIYINELVQYNYNLNEEFNLLNKHKNNLEKQIYLIKNSKAYKFWQFFNLFKNRDNLIEIKNVLIKRRFSPKKFSSIINKSKYIKKTNLKKVLKKYKISVIIPTFNAEPFLKPLLRAIIAQKNIDDLEIIIVDSESRDGTRKIAEQFGAKVITIKQNSFNHGIARNIGAEQAKYDLLLFTVQDALPKNNELFSQMAELLERQDKIAAVSTIQHARPDADLFARWQVDHHKQYLKLNYNTISYIKNFKNFNKEPFFIKRRVSLLDNVCSIYKKNIFNELSKFKNITFAEDLDFALKALKSGFSLGLLTSSGVIHSHNRSAHYFLKRTFLSTLIESKILTNVNNLQSNELIKEIKITLILLEFFRNFRPRAFQTDLVNLKKFLNNFSYKKDINFKAQPTKDLYEIFKKLSNDKVEINTSELTNYYLNVFNILDNYLLNTEIIISNNEEIKEFLEKILVTKIGSNLSNYYLNTKNKKEEKIKKFIFKLLSGDV